MAGSPTDKFDDVPTDAPSDGPPAADGQDTSSEQETSTQQILRMVSQARDIDQGKSEIMRLQEQRRQVNAQKRALSQELRNQTRKRQRLINKSAKLSVPDLVQSLYIRQTRAEERARRAAVSADADGTAR